MPQTYQPLGNEFTVNTTLAGVQGGGAVTFLPNGNYYIKWFDTTADVNRVQFYYPDGATASDEVLLTASVDGAIHSSAATTPLSSGGFVAAWLDDSGLRVKAQIYDGSGHMVGSQFQITVTDGFYRPSAIGVQQLPTGGFMAIWTNRFEGLHMQAYDVSGSAVGPHHFDPLPDQDHSPYAARLLPLASGGYAVAYTLFDFQPDPEAPQDYTGFLIKVYDSSWNLIHVEEPSNFSTGVPAWSLQNLANGGFVLAYKDFSGSFRVQIYDDGGHAVGSAIGVSSLGGTGLAVTALPDGGFVVTWSGTDPLGRDTDGTAALAQFYDSSGHEVGHSILINNVTVGNQSLSSVALSPTGELIAVWTTGNANSDVVARRFHLADAPPPIVVDGTPGPDSLTGTAADETINGLGDNDVLDGLAGSDILRGGAGKDILFGGSYGEGQDILDGGAGDDTMFVDRLDIVYEAIGGGYDNVATNQSYFLNPGAEVEVLSTNNHSGTGEIDLRGNEFGQVIIGNAGSNRLSGGGGADLLVGLGGNDHFTVDADDRVAEAVGGGVDTVTTSGDYVLNAGAEVEFLRTGGLYGHSSVTLVGNEFSQRLDGDLGNNVFNGGGGADSLNGYGGDDTYFADADDSITDNSGYDSVVVGSSYALATGLQIELLSTTNHGGTAAIDLTGNAFGQVVIGNAGANILDGGLGNDLLQSLGGADTFAFTTAPGAGNVDTILDFLSGTDKIGLDDAVFTGLTAGPLPAGAFVTGTAALDADDRIIYDSATGALYFDADGVGGVAMVQFATLTGHPALVAGDFTVI
jgi:Ca2+-binding RTX toxin-like protein